MKKNRNVELENTIYSETPQLRCFLILLRAYQETSSLLLKPKTLQA